MGLNEERSAESERRLTETEQEGFVEAIQAGTAVEYVEALIADRLARSTLPEKDAGDFGHAAEDVEALASLIQEAFPTGAGGYRLIWEDCFPAAAAILDAGWTRPTPPGGQHD